MRFAFAVLLLAGCPIQGGECVDDFDCTNGEVCARDHACTTTSNVREVRAEWTINGIAPDGALCGDTELFIEFQGLDRDDTLRFKPVPCETGQFTVDKLPLRFGSVELGVTGGGDRDVAEFDSAGVAILNLDL